MRLYLAIAVALSSLALVPAGLAAGEPAPLQPRAPAAGRAAAALLPFLFGDGLVGGADFSLDLGRHSGARIVYFDPSTQWLFRDRTISKVVWGTSSVSIVGIGTLNGKRVKFVVFAADGGDQSNGTFRLSVNGGVAHGGSVAEGTITIG